MRRLFSILAVLALLAVPCLGKGKEKTYHLRCAIPFDITLPAEWVRLPDKVIKQRVAIVHEHAPDAFMDKELCIFHLGTYDPQKLPGLTVSVQRERKGIVLTTDSVIRNSIGDPQEDTQSAEQPLKEGPRVIHGGIRTVSFSYDAQSHTTFDHFIVEPESDRFPPVAGLVCTKYTKIGAISLRFTSMVDEYTMYEPMFKAIVKSMRVRHSAELKAPKRQH